MLRATNGVTTPTRRILLTFTALAVILSSAPPARADSGLADTTRLPRIEGAVESEARGKPDTSRISYTATGSVAQATETVRKLLIADGWLPYMQPYQQTTRSQFFKKGRHALLVSISMAGGKHDRSTVSYTATRIDTNVPVPADATDIVFDEARPYLSAVTPGSIDTTLGFFRTGLAEDGWLPLQPGDLATRWPGAKLADAPERGARAYFIHPDKRHIRPIQLSLTPQGDGRTAIDIRSASFALPQALDAGSDMAGLPRPTQTKGVSSTGSADSPQREMRAAVIAELPVTLAFYRSEMRQRGWTEEAKDAVVTSDEVKLTFTSAESRAQMQIGRHHDLTIVQIIARDTEAAMAAKARAKKEASNRFMQDALGQAQALIAASEDKRRTDMAAAAQAPVQKLAAHSRKDMPIPLPDAANDVNHDATNGQLDFSSTSSVKSLAAFYRETMKAQGWSERPSVINNPTMAVLNFSKAKNDVALTIMQMGPKVTMRASGPALKTAAAQAKVADGTVGIARAEPVLESDGNPTYPTPKPHTLRTLGTAGLPGGAPFRHELNASIPAGLDNVLGFYRSELGKRQWQELANEAAVKSNGASLAFKTPDGPAILKLERHNGGTTVNLVVRHPEAAAKAGILPATGKVRLLLGNMGDTDVSVTIAGKTIKVGAGVGSPKKPDGPTLDVAPGAHRIVIKAAGSPAQETKLTVAANDSWGIMVGPGGRDIVPLQLY